MLSVSVAVFVPCVLRFCGFDNICPQHKNWLQWINISNGPTENRSVHGVLDKTLATSVGTSAECSLFRSTMKANLHLQENFTQYNSYNKCTVQLKMSEKAGEDNH